MGWRYYDHETGTERIKRRYVWAVWGFAAGALSVWLLMLLH